MAKILLANPPTYEHAGSFFRPVRFPTYNYATPVMHPPLYLAYAASFLRNRGHAIALIDAPVLGISVADFIRQCMHVAPDIVVFETSTPSFYNDCSVAREIKEKNRPVPKIVFVGTHVTALPEESLEEKAIDAVILGEYEHSLAAYVDHGARDTEGVAYRECDGRIVVNKRRAFCDTLDTLPFPARDLLPNERYFDPILKNPFTFVVSGRGCPYACSFCNWPEHLTGRRYRKRSPENVVDEVAFLVNTFHFKSILFNDDTFTADRDHAMAIARQMRARGITIPWGCYARADHNDEEMLRSLKDAGCFLLKIGVESADEAILKRAQKNYTIARVRSAVRTMLRLGFHVHATFAFGLPGETHETIRRTRVFARELGTTTVQFSIAVPYPGTEFYRYLRENGYLLTNHWDAYMPLRPIYEYPHLSYGDMQHALRHAYRTHYLRPKYFVMGLAQMLTQPSVFFGNVRKLSSLIWGRHAV